MVCAHCRLRGRNSYTHTAKYGTIPPLNPAWDDPPLTPAWDDPAPQPGLASLAPRTPCCGDAAPAVLVPRPARLSAEPLLWQTTGSLLQLVCAIVAHACLCHSCTCFVFRTLWLGLATFAIFKSGPSTLRWGVSFPVPYGVPMRNASSVCPSGRSHVDFTKKETIEGERGRERR